MTPKGRGNYQRDNNYRDDMRFKHWVENYLTPGLVTYEEMGAIFGTKLKNGNIKPMTRQAIYIRHQQILKDLFDI